MRLGWLRVGGFSETMEGFKHLILRTTVNFMKLSDQNFWIFFFGSSKAIRELSNLMHFGFYFLSCFDGRSVKRSGKKTVIQKIGSRKNCKNCQRD